MSDSSDEQKRSAAENKSSRRDVGRSMGWFAMAQVAVRLVGLAVIVIVARLFTTEDFGRYSVALALASMLTVPVESGMGGYLVREGTQSPARLGVVLGHAMSLQAGLAVVAVAAAAALGSLLNYDRETFLTMILITVGMAVIIVTRSQMAVLVTLKRARQYAMFSSVQALLLATFTVAATVLGTGPVGVGWATLLTAVLSFPAAQLLLRRHWTSRITFQREGLRNTFTGSIAYSASKIGNALLSYLDAVMLQAFSGNAAAAQYGAASRFFMALRMFPQIYADSLSQPLARLAKTDRAAFAEVFNRGASQLFILGVPLAVGGFLLREPLMTTIFGDRYASSATAAGLLLLTLVVSFPRTAVVVSALAAGLERRVAIAYGVTIVVNVVSNLILIPAYGATGAALSMVISLPVFTIFLSFQLKNAGVQLKVDSRYGKAVLAGAAMAVGVALTAHLPLVVPVLVGVVTYTGALVALNTFDSGDLDMLPGGRRLGWLVRSGRPAEVG